MDKTIANFIATFILPRIYVNGLERSKLDSGPSYTDAYLVVQ